MKTENMGLATAFGVIALFVAAVVGWISNLVAIFQFTSETPIGWMIGRTIGVIIPIIGAVLGFV